MVAGRHVLLFGLILFSVVLLAGCSTATKSDPSSSGQAGTEQSRAVVPEARTPSSLEALQRGVLSVTPPASPLKDIYFDLDHYHLRADAQETLKANADWLKFNPSVRVEIEGHCDERGTNEYNLALGLKRAESVKDYLVSLGIHVNQLQTISYGEETPVCIEHTEECWQKNRRARFVIITTIPAS